MGSKLRCIRSTPTEKQSMSENDFECFASTGVNTPETMFPYSRTSGCIKQHSEKCVFLRDFSRSRDRAFLPQRSHQAHSRRVPAISRKFVSSCPQGLNRSSEFQCPPHASIDIVIGCPKRRTLQKRPTISGRKSREALLRFSCLVSSSSLAHSVPRLTRWAWGCSQLPAT